MPVQQARLLLSNRILIAGKPLEEWIGASVGKSQCCKVCGESECRTISTGQETFEVIYKELIVRAGLLAAAERLQTTIKSVTSQNAQPLFRLKIDNRFALAISN